jgi:hypothetical protein
MTGKLFGVAATLGLVLGLAGATPAGAACAPTAPYYCIPGPPTATTTGGVVATSTTATLPGTVNPNGLATTYHFEYGTSSSALVSTSDGNAGADFSDHNVSAPVVSLAPCTVYVYRVVASNTGGPAQGALLNFSTGGCYGGGGGSAGPAVTTELATNVTNAGATLNGTVNPGGKATTVHFEFGPTTTYGTQTTPQSAGSGSTTLPISTPIVGLQPNTLYHYRAVASNSDGARTGQDQTFTTNANGTPNGEQGAPTIGAASATGVGTTSATLHGTVNPQGVATQYSFAFGTSTGYGSVTPAASVEARRAAATDSSDHTVTARVTGLKPNTTYHFRVMASNALGTTTGGDHTFKTSKPKPRVTLRARPRHDHLAPYRYRASGHVVRPSSVSRSAGCKGRVHVTLRRAGRLVGSGTARVRSSCAYSKRVRVTRNLSGAGRLKVRASFGGNGALRKATAPTRTVRYG